MNNLVLVKTEIVCLFILGFLLYYSFMYCKDLQAVRFRKICILAISHVIMAIVTVVTVNNRDIVPVAVNDMCHALFFITGIMFSLEFFLYVLGLTSFAKNERIFKRIGYILLACYFIETILIKPVYIDGVITDYSYGIPAISGFVLCVGFNIGSLIILLADFKRVDKMVWYTIVPIDIVALIGIITQIIFSEFLFTEANATIITIGLFFSIENPAGNYLKKAFTDEMTGLKNKNCFNEDMQYMARQYNSEKEMAADFTYVICDINDLKKTNDQYGHLAGDELIRLCAKIIFESMDSAFGVYRIGGDEFVAIYISKDNELVEREIQVARDRCVEVNKNREVKISIAIGYSGYEKGVETIRGIMAAADNSMYSHKRQEKNDK